MQCNENYQYPECQITDMLTEGVLCNSQISSTTEDFSNLDDFVW